MHKIFCYGIIPLQLRNGVWWTLIIQRVEDFWEFPKGHANPQEAPLTAAKRELFEETGLTIKNLSEWEPLIINYSISSEEKAVTYFMAEVEGELTLQTEEVQNAKWLPLEEAATQLTYENSKDLALRALFATKAIDRKSSWAKGQNKQAGQ